MTDAAPAADTPDATPKAAIGFPAPLLGKDNLRLDVIYNANGLLAVEKPPFVLMGAHPWHLDLPVLSDAINEQLSHEKPELLRLGLKPGTPLEPIFHYDPSIAGIGLLAIGPQASAKARNAFGSSQFLLTFHLIAVGGPETDEASCDMPVARHNNLPMALISKKTGKKTSTLFRRLERYGKYSLWSATTNYYRADQLPIHATQLGIRIPGEDRYGHEKPLYLSKIKRHWEGDRETEEPMYEAPTAWLAEVKLPDGTVIKADAPKRLANAIKQLGKYCKR
jgi:23S rRNA-/tRNA-specific pseudouridylate synthase